MYLIKYNSIFLCFYFIIFCFQRKHPSAMQRTSIERTETVTNAVTATASTPFGLPLKQAKLSAAATNTQSRVNARIFDFVFGNAQPFSLVEDADFHKLMEAFSDGKTPMCRKTLMQCIEKAFQSMKRSMTIILHGIHTVCTTADIWTAHHRSYLACKAHSCKITMSLSAILKKLSVNVYFLKTTFTTQWILLFILAMLLDGNCVYRTSPVAMNSHDLQTLLQAHLFVLLD